jgi:glycosyltransferase involved in cell wall biosynthesis
MQAPLFTVFTPTYNRAHTLARVYESVASQDFRDFEWLIVDDGSTDNSEELVSRWISEAGFPIRYIHQANGHKKTAFNRGVREAQGDLFLCLDSDDAMPTDALRIFHDQWFAIPLEVRDQFAGVTGICVDEDNNIIGDSFPSSPFDSDDLTVRFGLGVRGEKWGFHRRSILEQYPYPEYISGFVVEGLVWNAIAHRYKTRFVNEVVRIYYAEPDSLVNSPKTLKKMRDIAEGSSYAYANLTDGNWRWFPQAPLEIAKIAISQTRFAWHLSRTKKDVVYHPQTIAGWVLKLITWPIGFAAFLYDEFSLQRQ